MTPKTDKEHWQPSRGALQILVSRDSLQFSRKLVFRAALFEVESVLLQLMQLPLTCTEMTLYNYSILSSLRGSARPRAARKTKQNKTEVVRLLCSCCIGGRTASFECERVRLTEWNKNKIIWFSKKNKLAHPAGSGSHEFKSFTPRVVSAGKLFWFVMHRKPATLFRKRLLT